jgi:fructosamine-3-kinase
MINDLLLQHLSLVLQYEGILSSPILSFNSVSGGSVNQTFALNTANQKVFLKLNSKSLYPGMFEKERMGLNLLRKSTSLHVPLVLCIGEFEDFSYLILEFIDTKIPKSNFWENFGYGLAELHFNRSENFGLEYHNYNGSLNQKNDLSENWLDFFIENRLRYQERLAIDQGKLDIEVSKLLDKLYRVLPNVLQIENPSLLHGDLWSGNFMSNHLGQPSIMDPAVYYGHREVDISMSLLFGGFDKEFYHAYESVCPLEKGWEKRVEIYNLYPLLVHVNLFGASYSQRVKSILKRLV